MKIFILEGADLDQRNAAGKPILSGWRHYRFIRAGRGSNLISHPITPEKAAQLGAKLFPRGSWEDTSREVPPDMFPFPTAAVAEEIYA